MTPSNPPGEIRVGTSGYSFPDWVGPFYPPGMKSGEFLSSYSRQFDVVEVNSTYYRIPPPRVIEQMERKTPDDFHFVVKLHQSMTHEGDLESSNVRDFLAALAPLQSAGKYDGLLAQFPWGFRRSRTSLEHLVTLREKFPGEPLWVEFRHDSWAIPEVPVFLREHALGFCAVDEPALQGLMPPVTAVTTDCAYVRFHGRNAGTWWARPARPNDLFGPATGASGGPEPSKSTQRRERGGGDRYDYDYSAAELGEWVKRIAELAQQARRTYLFFNNCHAGQAARNASLMKELLRQQQLPA
ncbi:MAG: DUF72 domain-containing protein [Candidatus Eisenbacteria bacterium]|nr:DUF72 domain-containing protein [Candidatus Eisenbacteria bacterium]